MSHRFRFVVAGTLIALLSAGIGYAVSAGVPVTLRPAGTTRYAFMTLDTVRGINSTFTWEPTLLSTSVTIPSGKQADVAVLFCSLNDPNGLGIYVRAKIGGALLEPEIGGEGMPLNVAGPYQTNCVNFLKTNVSAGTKTVRVEWFAQHAEAYLWGRSMQVTLNIH